MKTQNFLFTNNNFLKDSKLNINDSKNNFGKITNYKNLFLLQKENIDFTTFNNDWVLHFFDNNNLIKSIKNSKNNSVKIFNLNDNLNFYLNNNKEINLNTLFNKINENKIYDEGFFEKLNWILKNEDITFKNRLYKLLIEHFNDFISINESYNPILFELQAKLNNKKNDLAQYIDNFNELLTDYVNETLTKQFDFLYSLENLILTFYYEYKSTERSFIKSDLNLNQMRFKYIQEINQKSLFFVKNNIRKKTNLFEIKYLEKYIKEVKKNTNLIFLNLIRTHNSDILKINKTISYNKKNGISDKEIIINYYLKKYLIKYLKKIKNKIYLFSSNDIEYLNSLVTQKTQLLNYMRFSFKINSVSSFFIKNIKKIINSEFSSYFSSVFNINKDKLIEIKQYIRKLKNENKKISENIIYFNSNNDFYNDINIVEKRINDISAELKWNWKIQHNLYNNSLFMKRIQKKRIINNLDNFIKKIMLINKKINKNTKISDKNKKTKELKSIENYLFFLKNSWITRIIFILFKYSTSNFVLTNNVVNNISTIHQLIWIIKLSSIPLLDLISFENISELTSLKLNFINILLNKSTFLFIINTINSEVKQEHKKEFLRILNNIVDWKKIPYIWLDNKEETLLNKFDQIFLSNELNLQNYKYFEFLSKEQKEISESKSLLLKELDITLQESDYNEKSEMLTEEDYILFEKEWEIFFYDNKNIYDLSFMNEYTKFINNQENKNAQLEEDELIF
ncbi:hypothetical protein RRG49_00700 [Mycoplasmopsis felis]|uniref:hypothetical protein n=1 Tax=Mycoplasmopsis felis TaxID=33923 RepID=UPI0021E06F40|nr:hypothetical protein [Mycoplasmopsis felis]MCU9932350.1 hypothetical protein [Mycoplasmopsis felis]MCU9938074.1 hypothetical protein [Mycoplasmopsis felis]WQQ09514.1 hypothetical protein RRG41_01080 [Mycoplasmopsis felis]